MDLIQSVTTEKETSRFGKMRVVFLDFIGLMSFESRPSFITLHCHRGRAHEKLQQVAFCLPMSHFALTLSFYFWRFVCFQTTVFQQLSSPFIPLGELALPISSTPAWMTRLSPDLCLLICKESQFLPAHVTRSLSGSSSQATPVLPLCRAPLALSETKPCLRHIRSRGLSTETSWFSFGALGCLTVHEVLCCTGGPIACRLAPGLGSRVAEDSVWCLAG